LHAAFFDESKPFERYHLYDYARSVQSALQHDRLPEIGEGSSVCEEFALDFGWQSAPSHDDGRA